MATWRKKQMRLEEWAMVQDRFADLQMAHRGNPELALFIDSRPGEEVADVYMTGPGIEVIERLSGGGWQDAGRPRGEHLSLLVGDSDAWARFGIDRKAPH